MTCRRCGEEGANEEGGLCPLCRSSGMRRLRVQRVEYGGEYAESGVECDACLAPLVAGSGIAIRHGLARVQQ